MDDAAFLINRDMQQEILYKQIQRLKNQIRESESHTLDQWRAIDDEHKRHESELSRIENARQEATEQRRKRLLENQEKEAGAAEAAGEPSPAPRTGPAEATAESDRKPAAKTEAATLVRRDSKFDANESVAEQRAPQVGQIMSEKQNSSENLF